MSSTNPHYVRVVYLYYVPLPVSHREEPCFLAVGILYVGVYILYYYFIILYVGVYILYYYFIIFYVLLTLILHLMYSFMQFLKAFRLLKLEYKHLPFFTNIDCWLLRFSISNEK